MTLQPASAASSSSSASSRGLLQTYASCVDIKAALPASTSGTYTITPPGFPAISVYCDFTTDAGGYTYYPCRARTQNLPLPVPAACCLAAASVRVDDGASLTAPRQPRFPPQNCPSVNTVLGANGCTAVGLQMVIPRSRAHLQAMFSWIRSGYGGSPGIAKYFVAVPGISKNVSGRNDCCPPAAGSPCYAMGQLTSDFCGRDPAWRATDGGRFWLRDTAYTEPNGSYTANCLLSLSGWATIDTTAAALQFADNFCKCDPPQLRRLLLPPCAESRCGVPCLLLAADCVVACCPAERSRAIDGI